MNPHPMKRGEFVWTWFDTGAMGSNILIGRVVKAGSATYTVEWESGIRNRVMQGYRGINHCYAEMLPWARQMFEGEKTGRPASTETA